MSFEPSRHVEHFRVEADRCAVLAKALPHPAPIPHFPRWSVGGVVRHLVGDFRWATRIVDERTWDGQGFSVPRAKGDRLLHDYVDAARQMAEALERAAVEPDVACPNFADGGQGVLGWWPRHQAHETLLHRWDLEASTGAHDPILPEIAADAIDEAFTVYTARYSPHRLDRPISLACTDTAAAWIVRPAPIAGRVEVEPWVADGVPDLSCRAEDLLLAMWKRRSIEHAHGGFGADESAVRSFLRGPVTA